MTAIPTPTQAPRDTRANRTPVIVCAGVTKIFRDFWFRSRVEAVKNIDFHVEPGEVFGLLGPNGSGKSTTIKMLLGLLRPTSGRIAVFGHTPEDVTTKHRIGYLPEESYLYRFLNARETLDYYGRLFHQKRAQRLKRIEMLLEMVGLQAVARRPVGEYSKGMQRRIGLAQALINDPELLILDEPTTGMDPLGTRQIKDLILELKRRGKTILLCSHLLSDVEDVCDRVSIMYGGKIRRLGTVDELLSKDDTTTVSMPTLDDQTINEIEQLLATKGMSILRVDHPKQRLEQLFLDIVHQAQKDGEKTSGARSDGKMAEFLMSTTGPVEGDAVISDLLTKGVEKPAEPSDAQQIAAAKQVQDESLEETREVLDSLTTPVDTTPPPRESVTPEPAAEPSSPDPSEPKAPPRSAASDKPAPTKRSADGEQPDQSFIDALLDVPPYEERDDKSKSEKK